jgi:hypothetical protein
MQIQLLKPLLINRHNHKVGDILDYEVDGDRKKLLVEKGLADWYEAPKKPVKVPQPETATVKVPTEATTTRKTKHD